MKRYAICKGLALACSLVFLLFLMVPRACGQGVANGGILGSVTDPTGAVVPEAKVTVADPSTGRKWETQTSGGGLYDIEFLPAEGTLYDVTVEKQGFQTFLSHGNLLSPGARISVNATLNLAGAVSELTVSAAAVTVETTSGALAGVIAGNEVAGLQLNGRDFRGLALLLPGVNSSAITGSIVGGGSLSGGGDAGETPIIVNGLGREMNMYTIDGALDVLAGNNINLAITPPVEQIAEFRLIKDDPSAKYGGAGVAQIMVATKSGTNSFHGSFYDFLRNDALDSRNFFASSVPPLKQNIFGGSIGGPVYIPGHYNTAKNKTFFYSNIEIRRRNVGAVDTGSMIPQAMRSGDFTKSPTLAPGGLELDAGSATILANEHPGVNCVPDPYHLNPACLDKNALLLMANAWPLPNNPSGGFLNYLNSGVELKHAEDEMWRVDHNFNDKIRLLARVSRENVRDDVPYMAWGASPSPTQTTIEKQINWNNYVQLTIDINPTTLIQASAAWTDDHGEFYPTGVYLNNVPGLALNMPYGMHADPYARIPQITLSGGWASDTDGGFPLYYSDGFEPWTVDFTKVKGAHTIQAGTMLIYGLKKQNDFATPEGAYSFSGVHSGDPVADYLLGLDTSFSQSNSRLRGYVHNYQTESYIQDDWRVTRRLTLNLGVRAQWFLPDKIAGNDAADFNPALWNPSEAPVVNPNGALLLNANGQPTTSTGSVANLMNGEVIAEGFKAIGTLPNGTPGVPNGIFTTNIHFGPRFGFAYDLTGDGKTVVRGGYGYGFGRIGFGIYAQALGNYPFQTSVSLSNGTMTNPTLGSPGAVTPQSLGLIGFPPGRQMFPNETQTWNLTVEREIIPNGVFQLAYVGSASTHVEGSEDYNFPNTGIGPSINKPGCLQPGETIPSGGFQFDPCINAGLVSENYTRPYPGWGALWGGGGDVGTASGFQGTANYHSLQSGFNYRARHGLTFSAAYTYGHALSDVAQRGTDARMTGSNVQNSRDFKVEYGSPGFDRRQMFTSGYIWDLPLLRDRHDLLGTAFGSWTFSGISVIESGFVFAPGLSTSTPGLATRPNCVGPVSGPKTVAEWFNTSAFTAPAFGYFGNCGNGIIPGPGENTWNWSLYKTFPIKDRVKVQFRAEFFNIWNHTNFSTVSTNLGAGNFGAVTGALEPREVEFALHISY